MSSATAPDSRARILDSARRLFLERGYASTSLADIAADVGLTKTAVAYHFHPKEQLLTELVSPFFADMAAQVAPMPNRTPEERRAVLRRAVAVLVQHRHVIGILASDTALLPLTSPTGSARPSGVFVQRLLPERPTERDQVRAWAAVGSAQVAVARTLDLPADVVLEVATAAALAAYAS